MILSSVSNTKRSEVMKLEELSPEAKKGKQMKTLKELGISPAPWTVEANALGEMVLTCHDTDTDGKPWSEDFAQSWGATAEADANAFCALPALYNAARRAHAFLAHSSLIGAAEVRAELEAALAKAGGEE